MSDTPPLPAATPEPNSPAPDSGPSTATTSGLAPNVAAGLAALFPLVGGAVFLALEKRDKFVRFWAMQSVFFGGATMAVSVALRIAGFIFGMLPLIGKLMVIVLIPVHLVFGMACLAVWIIGIVKAFSGKEWEIPWLGALARKQLAQTDGGATPPAAPPAA